MGAKRLKQSGGRKASGFLRLASDISMLKPDEIEAGGIVRLACGSCKMSVEAVYTDDDGEDVADVLFFVDGKGIERDTVSLKHLVFPRTNEDAR